MNSEYWMNDDWINILNGMNEWMKGWNEWKNEFMNVNWSCDWNIDVVHCRDITRTKIDSDL
jgi:hypothetical protein